MYGEKEWLLLSDRFLPNRSVSIISQRYNHLCLLFYKSNDIRIDAKGDLLPAPDNPPPNWEARAKIVLTKVPLPVKFNVHRWSLLEDITNKGLESGLEIESITLGGERPEEFYVELPIEIIVSGNYHDLGSFVSGIAGLPRIVTLHDFDISLNDVNTLTMKITAKTYRYKDLESEDV